MANIARDGRVDLQMFLLGGFRVERADGAPASFEWPRRSAKILTKVLATLPAHAVHREQLLDIIWPGTDTPSALNSFGKALHAARRVLEPDLGRRRESAYLRLADAMLMLDTSRIAIDADRFERLAQEALRHPDEVDVGRCDAALAAYTGDLLPEDRYEDWCSERRDSLSQLRTKLLLARAGAFHRRGAYNESADSLREVLKHDPTREEIHRRLMSLYVEMGTPNQAVRQFLRCEQVLRDELDMSPQPETITLYRDVRASRIPSPRMAREDRETAPRRAVAAQARARPFVGREPIMNRLARQLSRGADRGPGMILLTGEAGVGKTRLLEEFAAAAGRQGAAVFWGGRGAQAGRFACGPFAVALEGYAAKLADPERRELAHRYPALARLVPSLAEGRRQPAAGENVDYQLDLFPDIVRLLTDIAARRSVLLALGDLNDADFVSLDLFRFLANLAAQHRPWLLVATVREEEVEVGTELARMLETTLRERLCTQVELRCLGRVDCDELVRATVPAEQASDDLLDWVYARSRGNPLYIAELARAIGAFGDKLPAIVDGPEPLPAEARAPARVRALTAMKLAAMDSTLRRVLGLAAAAGPHGISLGELHSGAAALRPAVSEPALLDALDRALQLRMLEEDASGYAFRHPLVRSALYESLPRHRRDELRTALAGSRAEQRWN